MNTLQILDKKYFINLGADTGKVKEETLQLLSKTSRETLLSGRTGQDLETRFIPTPESLSLAPHGNSLVCPRNILEITPVVGCHLNCRYCLVCAQKTMQKTVLVYDNYAEWLKKQFAKHRKGKGTGNLYYLSPRTEFLSPYLVRMGISQDILSVFVSHVKQDIRQYGRCLDTMLIITKGGIQDLIAPGPTGENVLELMKQIPNNLQVNTSITPLGPDKQLRSTLEPGARSVEDRLALMDKLQSEGILAQGALTEPLLFPFAYDASFYALLRRHGIKRVALDFLTSTYENLAVVFQMIGWYDRKAEKDLWEAYLTTDAPPKTGGRITMSISRQREHYAGVMDVIRKAGIDTVTYCMFAERNIRLNKADYGKSGCMAHLTPHPDNLQKARVAMAYA